MLGFVCQKQVSLRCNAERVYLAYLAFYVFFFTFSLPFIDNIPTCLARIDCFCDNKNRSYARVGEMECSSDCAGSATAKCGGELRNSVYQTSIDPRKLFAFLNRIDLKL